MVRGAAVAGVVNALTAALVLVASFAAGLPEGALARYPALALMFVAAGGTLVLAARGTTADGLGLLCLVLSSIALMGLVVAFLIAGFSIPGGDDGTGFRWFLFVGPPCLLSFVVGLVTLVLGLIWRGEYRRAAILGRCLCPHCTYDLRGTLEPRCPECGRHFTRGEWELLVRARTLARQPRQE